MLSADSLTGTDVAIEFTTPHAAPSNVALCLSAGIPAVCGTTGWNDGLDEAKSLAAKTGAAFLHASNFSIGVNIFFEINKHLARLMAGQPSYHAALEEVHHLQKKDAPSGTAITLAEQIILQHDTLKSWRLAGEAASGNELPVTALREEGVPGTHKVSWASAIDTIDIIHTAHNRDGFALGAVLAAEFIAGKHGVFGMSDVLGL
jgi:4-hydroxy-tetrahydrodipicolinate reductase